MIPPGRTLGVLGGGQLGRMFVLRARSIGYQVVVLEPDPRSPAGAAADLQIEAAYTDEDALAELAERCDGVTAEFENVPAGSLAFLGRRIPVTPPPAAVACTQDRALEKAWLRDHGFATARFLEVETAEEAARGMEWLGVPGILKTARLGYDGKGQVAVPDRDAARSGFLALGGRPCVLEERLALEAELSVVLARGWDGDIAAFPAGENAHCDGILDSTTVPARVGPELAAAADVLARRITESLDYVGVLGVELFVARGGRLYVNEVAPRPHNSGHYTLDACATDQFEQQVRTLCGLPLGSTRLLSPVAMVNLLGDLWAGGAPRWDRALGVPGARLHLYGKAEPRPGRKMGHLTVLADSADQALELALEARRRLGADTA